MDRSKELVVATLNEVLLGELDAAGEYQAAIRAISHDEIRRQLEDFRRDHERHIGELKAVVERWGGAPRGRADLPGTLRRGFTRMAGLVGDEAVLRAMMTNEVHTNEVYAGAVAGSLPPDVLDLLRRYWLEEQRHHTWIAAAVAQRLWEGGIEPVTP